MPTQIFGDFIEQFPPEQDSLELTFTPSSYPIRKRWRNHRLSAYFVADYFTNFLPADEDDLSREKRIKDSKGAVSYVANELLENAMKFNDQTSYRKVRFGIHFMEDFGITAAIFATNGIESDRMHPFQQLIQTLLSGDPMQLYMQQLEKSAMGSETSGLGLLTMINDYDAKLGWRFEAAPTGVIVTTMAQIKV